MVSDEAVRAVTKRKLKKLIDSIELLLATKTQYTVYDAHDVSEITINKLKNQLELNSLLMEETNSSDKKKLEEERKELQEELADELENGLALLDTIIIDLKSRGIEDKARQFEILMNVRESELLELRGMGTL